MSHRFCRKASHAAPPADTNQKPNQSSPFPVPRSKFTERVALNQHLRVGEALGSIHAERFEHLRGRGRSDP